MGRGLHQINPHVDSNIQQLKTGSASVSLNQSEAFDIF
jgi:hypothetical protein